MKKKKIDILQELISKKEENIKLLITWTNEDIKVMMHRYLEAKQMAYEDNRIESFKILEEKISQLREAKELKFSLSDEASEWIHW